jgi:type I restriction enzyme M protein
MDRLSQTLTQRVKELAERYETSTPQLTASVTKMERAVERHLQQMGFSWKLELATK